MLFMMAIQDPDEQVELLQKVLSVFQQPEVVAEFRAAKQTTSCLQPRRNISVKTHPSHFPFTTGGM